MTEERATYRVGSAGAEDIRETALLPFADPGYTKPTPDEIRAALSVAGLSGNAAAQLLGLSSGRKVRAWTSGESDMPYSAWRLLLLHAKLVDSVVLADIPGPEGERTVVGRWYGHGVQVDWAAAFDPERTQWRITGSVVDSRNRMGVEAFSAPNVEVPGDASAALLTAEAVDAGIAVWKVRRRRALNPG